MMYGSYFILIRALLRPHNTSEILRGKYPHPAPPFTGGGDGSSLPCQGEGWDGVVAAPKPAKHFISSTRTKGVPTCN